MRGKESGAIAVEMALLLPILILLLLGIMEFGRAYNAQVTLTSAAREGVRVMAITNVRADARTAAKNAAPTFGLADSNFVFTTSPTATSPAVCAAGRQVTVTISYSLTSLTGIAGPFSMTGRGVMQCGG